MPDLIDIVLFIVLCVVGCVFWIGVIHMEDMAMKQNNIDPREMKDFMERLR